MRPCPICNYLLSPSDQSCRFCGTDLAAADAAAAAAMAARAAEVTAAPAPSPFALSTSVFAAIGVGVVIVALVGWLAFRGGSDQPASASATKATSHTSTTAVTDPPASTTTMAPSPLPTSAAGYTLFGIPNASANLELPTGTQVGPIERGDFVRAELGGGTGLAIGSVDELPLGGTASSLLAYMQQAQQVSFGDYDDQLTGLKIVPNLAGPAVSFNYRLDDGISGSGTMVLIGKILVMVQLGGMPGTTYTPAQMATYNHAVASITGVL